LPTIFVIDVGIALVPHDQFVIGTQALPGGDAALIQDRHGIIAKPAIMNFLGDHT
jgi:hypothetical protein